MAEIIRFPRVRSHARASSTALNPKTDGETSAPLAFRASLISRKLSGVIFPRSRQLLTADAPTPARPAAAAVPPKASITSSTVVSMLLDTSQNVKLSSLHRMGIVTDCELSPNRLMARSISQIAERLVATQKALGVSPAELCRESGISQTQWTQFTDPKYKRRITVAAAYKLKDAYSVTLEWIFDGDRTKLPHDVRAKLREAA